jgi:hypothetical protein
MEKTQDTLSDNSTTTGDELTGTRKPWKTPELRILPVPTKTQGGTGNRNDQDDIFYRTS